MAEIAVIYGSVRKERQGIKAARFIVKKLEERSHNAALVDPVKFNLPLLDRKYSDFKDGKAPGKIRELHELFQKADGYVIVTGEYNHGVPPALKNIMDYFMKEYFFKPSAIVSYSNGNFGGVRAAMHWRAILPELGTSSIPSTFPISRVQEFSEDGTPKEDSYNQNVKRFLDEFDWYVSALKAAREKGVPY